ncbi:MAG TPA: hypothetical protein VEF04_07925, partial [Blastocatellia bacterium]|nr:hypothetical protein [Blastocatellia bacterium]
MIIPTNTTDEAVLFDDPADAMKLCETPPPRQWTKEEKKELKSLEDADWAHRLMVRAAMDAYAKHAEVARVQQKRKSKQAARTERIKIERWISNHFATRKKDEALITNKLARNTVCGFLTRLCSLSGPVLRVDSKWLGQFPPLWKRILWRIVLSAVAAICTSAFSATMYAGARFWVSNRNSTHYDFSSVLYAPLPARAAVAMLMKHKHGISTEMQDTARDFAANSAALLPDIESYVSGSTTRAHEVYDMFAAILGLDEGIDAILKKNEALATKIHHSLAAGEEGLSGRESWLLWGEQVSLYVIPHLDDISSVDLIPAIDLIPALDDSRASLLRMREAFEIWRTCDHVLHPDKNNPENVKLSRSIHQIGRSVLDGSMPQDAVAIFDGLQRAAVNARVHEMANPVIQYQMIGTERIKTAIFDILKAYLWVVEVQSDRMTLDRLPIEAQNAVARIVETEAMCRAETGDSIQELVQFGITYMTMQGVPVGNDIEAVAAIDAAAHLISKTQNEISDVTLQRQRLAAYIDQTMDLPTGVISERLPEHLRSYFENWHANPIESALWFGRRAIVGIQGAARWLYQLYDPQTIDQKV